MRGYEGKRKLVEVHETPDRGETVSMQVRLAAEMLASRPEIADSLITHRFPREDAAEPSEWPPTGSPAPSRSWSKWPDLGFSSDRRFRVLGTGGTRAGNITKIWELGSEADGNSSHVRASPSDPGQFAPVFERHDEAVDRYLARRLSAAFHWPFPRSSIRDPARTGVLGLPTPRPLGRLPQSCGPLSRVWE